MERDSASRFDRALPDERRRLVRIAFRMLGVYQDAEDVAQEAFIRWLRMSDDARDAVESPSAWLTTTVTRVCLDRLRARATRRAAYVGPWLPEPVPEQKLGSRDGADPAERAEFDDAVRAALLRVLERMTPAERVAFVLHDLFDYPFQEIGVMMDRKPGAVRQLASSGRKRLQQEPRSTVPSAEHARIVDAFTAASSGGDLSRLLTLLAPEVILRSDGGGIARAALNPITGADKVARFLLGVLSRRPDVSLRTAPAESGRAVQLVDASGVSGVITFEVAGEGITSVDIQWNPEKLRSWRPPT